MSGNFIFCCFYFAFFVLSVFLTRPPVLNRCNTKSLEYPISSVKSNMRAYWADSGLPQHYTVLPVNQCSHHHRWLTWSTWLCCQECRWTQCSGLASSVAEELNEQFVFSVSMQLGYTSAKDTAAIIRNNHKLPSLYISIYIRPELMQGCFYFLKQALRGDYSEMLSV